MFCHKCGANLIDGAKFCSSCGTPTQVEHAQESTESQETKHTETSWTVSTDKKEEVSDTTIKANASCRNCLIAFIILALLLTAISGGCVSVGRYVYRNYSSTRYW